MKPNNLSVLLIAVVCLFLTSCSSTEIKLMSWNIWHGGLHGSKADHFQKDTANTENVLKVILHEDPDIIFMQETYCCGMEIAKQAGYPYSLRGSSNLSIHSKYPITDTLDIYKPFNSHGAVIDINGKKLLCFNIWLHYLPDFFNNIKTHSPDSLIKGEGLTRLKEIQAILAEVDSIERIYQLPVVIGGDFNSGSHLDWVESMKHLHYNKVVEWPVSKMMTDNNFIDSFREAKPEPTTSSEGTWGFLSDDIISDRIDYIYYKGEKLKTKSSKIVMDDPPGGFFNSDHRAVLTVFDVK